MYSKSHILRFGKCFDICISIFDYLRFKNRILYYFSAEKFNYLICRSEHPTIGAEAKLYDGRRRLLLHSLRGAGPGRNRGLRLRKLPRPTERHRRGARSEHHVWHDEDYHQRSSVPVDVVDRFVIIDADAT